MKKWLGSLLAIGFLPLLSHCASQQDVQSMELRMRTLNNNLVELNRDINTLQNKTSNQAAIGNTLDRLQSDMLQVKSLIDENNQRFQRFQEDTNRRFQVLQTENQQRYQMLLTETEEQLKKFQADSQTRQAELDTRLANLSSGLEQLRQQNAQTSASLEGLRQELAKQAAEQAAAAARSAREAREKAVQAAQPREIEPEHQIKKKVEDSGEDKSAASPKASQSSAKDLYDEGYAQFKNGKYKEAYATFSRFLEKHSKSSLAPNARFWLGDSLYNQKEYELAILEYQKVIADYPKDDKAPAALLKQGLAFEKLRDDETAKIIYRKLVKEYPESEQAKTGQSRLQDLGK